MLMHPAQTSKLVSKLVPLVAAMALTLAAAGCTPAVRHYAVKGKLMDGEKAVLPDPKTSLLLTFVQQVEAEKSFNTYTARITEDVTTGEFLVTSNSGEGLPAGSYRVKIRSTSPQPSPAAALLN